MREIKFRAYSPTSGMWDWSMLLCHDFITLESLKSLEDWHVMQYTGLKDKNGKEIYEGDIIEMDGWEPKRSIVGFANGGFGFKSSMSDYYHSDISYVETSRGNAANVVGNIYENPDLLNS